MLHFYFNHSLRVCSFEINDLKKRKMIDLNEFENEVYVIFFKEFGGDSKVDLRVKFIRH